MKLKQLRLFKKNKLTKRLSAWIAKRPQWLKFAASVFGISLLTALLVVFFYDRFWGNSPWSNRQRFIKEAVAVCTKAQDLAAASVDFTDWPLKKKYDLEGQTLGTVSGYFDNYSAYAAEGGPTAAEAYTATSWLKGKYAEYYSSQDRCSVMGEEYQKKYQY